MKRLRDSVGCAYLVVEYVEVLSERDKPTHAFRLVLLRFWIFRVRLSSSHDGR